jgi:predicted phage terminase large subunit-like protein
VSTATAQRRAAALYEYRRRRREAPPIPDSYGLWLATARPEMRWDYGHFRYVQSSLDDVTAGRCLRLYTSLPIRHGKTEHGTIGYTAYRLSRDPRTRVVIASYSAVRAEAFSRQTRRLVRSLGVPLSEERDAAREWETAAGGGVTAVGAGAGLASVNADLIIVDDPIGTRADAESPAHRDRVWDWMTSDVLARCEPHTAVCLTMSRWHEDDPAGRLMDRQGDQWRVLDLPAIAVDGDALGRPVGAALWPEMRPLAWLEQQHASLGPYAFASLMQGRPRPPEGGMFQWDWWRLRDADAVPLMPLVRYWDMAGARPSRRGSDPDYTAGVLGGRAPDGTTGILHVDRFREEVAARDARIIARAREDQRLYGGRVTYWIEAQSGIGGSAATDDLLRQLHEIGMTAYAERATGDKYERMRPLASACLAGNVWLGPDDGGTPWRDALRLEAADAPTGRHDDQIDASAGMFNRLAVEVPTIRTLRPRV